MGELFILGDARQAPAGKAFYESETELAQDLNTFYRGKGVVVEHPVTKQNVKLYWLPADGILYKPAPDKPAVVLSPEKYFVVYDMENKTGQIVGNSPVMQRLFDTPGNSGTSDDIVRWGGKEFHVAIGEP